MDREERGPRNGYLFNRLSEEDLDPKAIICVARFEIERALDDVREAYLYLAAITSARGKACSTPAAAKTSVLGTT